MLHTLDPLLAELNTLNYRQLMLGQNFVTSSIPRDPPAKTPCLPASLALSSALGSNCMLGPKQGKASPFDLGACVCNSPRLRPEEGLCSPRASLRVHKVLFNL